MTYTIIRTMTEQIIAQIRERILLGAYAPGAPLLQDSIAAELGVSKIPVREALVRLRSEGLVDTYPHRGFYVRPLSLHEVREILNVRLAIEPEAVAQGSQLATPEDREAAGLALEALSAALVAGDLDPSGYLNKAFHLALVLPRCQTVTAEILDQLHTRSQRYVRIHLQPGGRARRANGEHAMLFQAWSTGDCVEAKQLIRSHIEETLNELTERFCSA